MRPIEPAFALTTREVSGVDGEKKMSAGSANNLSGHRHEPKFLAFSTDPAGNTIDIVTFAGNNAMEKKGTSSAGGSGTGRSRTSGAQAGTRRTASHRHRRAHGRSAGVAGAGCAPLQRRSRRKGRIPIGRMAKSGRPNTQLWTSQYASRLLITMKPLLHRALHRRYCRWLVTPRG